MTSDCLWLATSSSGDHSQLSLWAVMERCQLSAECLRSCTSHPDAQRPGVPSSGGVPGPHFHEFNTRSNYESTYVPAWRQ